MPQHPGQVRPELRGRPVRTRQGGPEVHLSGVPANAGSFPGIFLDNQTIYPRTPNFV